jgi:hypothetical protein
MLQHGPEGAKVAEEVSAHVCRSYEVLSAWLKANKYDKGKRYVEKSLALSLVAGDNFYLRARDIELQAEDHTYVGLNGAEEIGGTGDLIVVPHLETRPILVCDHKTGLSGDFSAPEKMPQLIVLGVAACGRYGRSKFLPAVFHSPKDGLPTLFVGPEVAVSDVYFVLEELAKQLSRIGDGSMRPGPECKYCPARHQCPAKTGDLLADASSLVEKATLVGSELVLVANTNGTLTREEKIGRLHLLFARFHDLEDRAKDEMKRALREEPGLEPIRPDGKRLVLKTRNVERLSKSSILSAYGKVEGARKLDELRKDGALVTAEETMLWAE